MDLHNKIEAARPFAPTHPHPSAPTGNTTAKIVNPVLGVIDRVSDTLVGRSHPEGQGRNVNE